MMAFDMTAQLAPVVWGMFGVLFASAVGIVATAWPRSETKRPASRPIRALRPAAVSA
jgi:hypothetical protein